MRVEIIKGLDEVAPAAWDALVGENDPFSEHAYLHALETSASVGTSAGWLPLHVLAWRGTDLVGALPLYAKGHSYGEYIFDWAWANAARQLGARYYPKLTAMAPFTPATGRRLLCNPGEETEIAPALLSGVREVAQQIEASSIHLLFLESGEVETVCDVDGYLPRLSYQFHWRNDGYGDFDDYVGRFRSKARKELRRERRQVAERGIEVRVVEGPELSPREWTALEVYYRNTCAMHGSMPYLTPDFFGELRTRLAHRVVACLAYVGARPVAGSLNFEKGGHLYGRYWGAVADYAALHFEVCYYRLIERCIERGLTRFEAGAQGMHKLRRGLLPAPIHSAHWVRHPTLRGAVADFLQREAAAHREDMAALADHGPFRRGGAQPSPGPAPKPVGSPRR